MGVECKFIPDSHYSHIADILKNAMGNVNIKLTLTSEERKAMEEAIDSLRRICHLRGRWTINAFDYMNFKEDKAFQDYVERNLTGLVHETITKSPDAERVYKVSGFKPIEDEDGRPSYCKEIDTYVFTAFDLEGDKKNEKDSDNV